jgi:glyceraldehyde-3-phosphate dehydrogenase (NAD(P))
MERKIVHVIGTGTIGEPLIGLLSDYRDQLGIDEVTFHKNSALRRDRSKVSDLLRRGARLSVDEGKEQEFRKLGLDPDFETEESIKRSTVVIDCTPKGVGHSNKVKYYEKFSDTVKGFLAQGSEDGFGKKYARGINDHALVSSDKFIQIVSCNTHNISKVFVTQDILWVLHDTIWMNLSEESKAWSLMPRAYFFPNPSSLPWARNPFTVSENFS